MVLITMVMPMMVSADKITKTAQVVYQDDYETEWLLGLGKNEKIDVSVTVVSPVGAKVDVYVISSSQFSNYPNGNFNPTVAKENVASTSFSFKSPDDSTYYLVIDNEDNSRTSDAVPTGDITVDYEYDDPLAAIFEEAEDVVETAFLICIAGIVIIVVVIIVIIVVVIKVASKGKQPPVQPQQPYPQQQYQQPYQQPPPGSYPPPQQPVEQPPPDQPQQQGYYPPPDQPQQ
jgi:hypothetical protein